MELIEILKKPTTTIVDVRSESEFDGGHINGALNIPLHEIPEKLEEFKKMQGDVVVYCAAGGRSANAKAYLSQSGIVNVYDAGGIGNISMLMMNVK